MKIKATHKGLGEKIRNARLSLYLSQKEFGKLINVSERTVNRYEHEIINPLHRIDNIAKVLQKDINYFLEYLYPLPTLQTTKNSYRNIPLIKSLNGGISKALFKSKSTYPCPEWIYKRYRNSLFALKLKSIKSKKIQIQKDDIGIFTLNSCSELKLVQEKRKWIIKKSKSGKASLIRLERNFI